MPADEDLLFGKIAIREGYCTQAQVDECIRLQSSTSPGTTVGALLLIKGYVGSVEHAKILELQKRNFQAAEPRRNEQKESLLFGKLAVREGLLTEEEVNECLREQARPGEKRTLGEIMVDHGCLTAAQVEKLLGKQQKRFMSCPACKLSFTVLTLSQGKTVLCPRCKAPLQERSTSGSTRTDAEIVTQVLQVVKVEVPAALRPVSRVIPAFAKPVTAICVVCDSVFQGALDSTGRVRCPSCHAMFAPAK
jgi:hypothetical protein